MNEKLSKARSVRSRSSISSRNYPRIGRRKITPGIPKAANWGWGHLPLPAKIMIAGVLAGVISLTTPYWAYIRAKSIVGLATFGLWHYCNGEVCTSIHDNLVDGRSVEAWYHFTQGSMCIGVACSIVSLAMLTNSIEGKKLKMTPTVHRTVSCVLAISALEHFVALFIFANYLEDTDFLFRRDMMNRIDFYGSYYVGIVSFICSLVTAFIIYLNDNITKREKPKTITGFNPQDPEHIKLLQEYYQRYGYYVSPDGYANYGTYAEAADFPGDDEVAYQNGGYNYYEDEASSYNGWYESPPDEATSG